MNATLLQLLSFSKPTTANKEFNLHHSVKVFETVALTLNVCEVLRTQTLIISIRNFGIYVYTDRPIEEANDLYKLTTSENVN